MGENIENTEGVRGSFPKETGFTTPEGYFEDLTQRITSGIYLNAIKSTQVEGNGFIVPDGYFENLTTDILAKTTGQQNKSDRKVMRLWQSKLVQYASAACFLLITGAGVFFINQQNQQLPVNYAEFAAEQMLYDIDEQVIIEHIEANESQQPKAPVTDAELENYILNNYSQNDLATGL